MSGEFFSRNFTEGSRRLLKMSVFYVTGCREGQEEEFIPMNTNDANHNPSFTPQRKFYSLPPVLRPLPKDGATLSPKNRIFLSKRKKPFCNQFRIVVSFLLFFVLLSFVMTILFLWQVHLRSKGQAAASPKKNLVEDPASSCIPLPKPIPLAKLSERLNDKLQEMEKFIVKNMAVNKGFGALSANLVYRDKIIWRGTFGVMNKSEITPRKPSTASVYPCASISKVITALIAYKLLDENMITSLDEPVTKYDPDFKIKNPFNNHNITLRNLLSMTSGIQREAPCFTTKKNNFCPFDHNTMLKRIQNLSLLVEPNTILQYSNFGYALLGNVLAKRFTSGDFGALAKKYVLEPLGMDSTKFSINLSQLKHVPVAYVEDGKPAKVYDWGWLNPGGGMFTTVDDLTKMVKELLTDRNQGRYLSKYTTRELLSVASVMPDGKTMAGTPWEMELVDGIVYREKGGSVFGYEGRVVMVPELRIALNVLCTNCFGFISNLISTSFVKQIVPSLEQELRKHQDQKLTLPPDYEAYIGSYTTNDIPFIKHLTIIRQDNKLLTTVETSPLFFLNYTAPRTFRFVVNTAKVNCKITYAIANENDIVMFDAVSSRDGLSHGFTLFGAHPTGISYFLRVPST